MAENSEGKRDFTKFNGGPFHGNSFFLSRYPAEFHEKILCFFSDVHITLGNFRFFLSEVGRKFLFRIFVFLRKFNAEYKNAYKKARN